MTHEPEAGLDRQTRRLLGMIALGIWALVALQAWQAITVRELMAEVYAIGGDTQAIHDHLDPPGEDDTDESATRGDRPRHRTSPHRHTVALQPRGPADRAPLVPARLQMRDRPARLGSCPVAR